MLQTSTTPPEEVILSHNTLRKAIGWLGLLLPFMLIAGNELLRYFDLLNSPLMVDTACTPSYTLLGHVKPTISDTYYTPMGEYFTGTLGSIALFMLCYKGHKLRPGEHLSDNLLTNLIGICAFLVALFPTSATMPTGLPCLNDNFRVFQSGIITNTFHFTSATILFLCLGRMSYTNFRRSNKQEEFGLGSDDKYFKILGIIIYLSVALLFVYKVLENHLPESIKDYCPFYWLEATALVAFGLSWLIKGKADMVYLPKKLGMIKSKPMEE